MKRGLITAVVSVLCFAVPLGCADSTYRLPAPGSAGAAQSDEPDQEHREQRNPDLEARARLLILYQLLAEERFEETEHLLSQQTREFLAHSGSGDASHSLSVGEISLPNGRKYRFEPIEFLIGGEIARIANSADGVEEHETERRREFFVVDPQEQAHRVVMIREGGEWVLHKTSANPNQENDGG